MVTDTIFKGGKTFETDTKLGGKAFLELLDLIPNLFDAQNLFVFYVSVN